jgi:hypothetical protein
MRSAGLREHRQKTCQKKKRHKTSCENNVRDWDWAYYLQKKSLGKVAAKVVGRLSCLGTSSDDFSDGYKLVGAVYPKPNPKPARRPRLNPSHIPTRMRRGDSGSARRGYIGPTTVTTPLAAQQPIPVGRGTDSGGSGRRPSTHSL